MSFLTTICIAALAAGLFRLLVPESALSKEIMVLVVCVFMLTALGAVSGDPVELPDFSSEITDYSQYSELSAEVTKDMQKRICTNMSEKLTALLHENGYFPEEIHVIVNISELGGISISQVRLVFPKNSEAEAEKAAELVREELCGTIAVTAQTKE